MNALQQTLQISTAIGLAVAAAQEPLTRKATVFVTGAVVVKAARRHQRSSRTTEILLTIGKPNYAERKLIARDRKTPGIITPGKAMISPWRKPRR